MQPLLYGAAGASSGVQAARLPAAWAAAPRVRVWEGAGRAEGLVTGAAADRAGLAAASAPGPAFCAGPAPGLAGGLGDLARHLFLADVAGQDLPRPASIAQRPVRGPGADPAAPAAGDAGLLVGRVGDQAV